MQDELTTHERILLQTIKFDLQVEHPYACLLKFAKQLHGVCVCARVCVCVCVCACVCDVRFLFQGEKAKIEKLVQMSWTFVNDRYGAC